MSAGPGAPNKEIGDEWGRGNLIGCRAFGPPAMILQRLRTGGGPLRNVVVATLARRGLKVPIGDLRKGDWIEHEGRVYTVNQINSSFSGRGARNFLVRRL